MFVFAQKFSKLGPVECSKCGEPVDREIPDNTAQWCRACRAKYQREYQAMRKEMTQSRGYAAGVAAMRGFLAENFLNYGTAGSFTGAEIASIIMTCRGPE